MAARQPFWKWRHWKSIGFCLWPPSTCNEIWNWNSKGNLTYAPETMSSTDRRTDGRTDGWTRWIQDTPPPTSLGGGIIKMSSYQYRKSHCGYKTVVRSSYLHNGISYTGKMWSIESAPRCFRNRTSVETLLHDDVIKWKHFCITGPLWGESTGHQWIPLTKDSGVEFGWVFFYLRLNKWLNKQWWGWWLEMPSHPLWRQRVEINEQK